MSDGIAEWTMPGRMSTCPPIRCRYCGTWFQLGGHRCWRGTLVGRWRRFWRYTLPCRLHGHRMVLDLGTTGIEWCAHCGYRTPEALRLIHVSITLNDPSWGASQLKAHRERVLSRLDPKVAATRLALTHAGDVDKVVRMAPRLKARTTAQPGISPKA
jgi:hypothetical protein